MSLSQSRYPRWSKLACTPMFGIYRNPPPTNPHWFWPGHLVLVKKHYKEPLASPSKGPYTIILMMPTVVMVDWIHPWVHHSIWSLFLKNIRTQNNYGSSSLINRTHWIKSCGQKTSRSRVMMKCMTIPRGPSKDKTYYKLTITFCFILMITLV